MPIDFVEGERHCYVIPFFTSFADTVYLGGETPSRISLPLVDFTPAAVASSGPSLPRAFRVSHAWPNPFRNRTTLRVSLRRPESVTFRVLDVLGRTVRVYATDGRATREYAFTWDGRDATGRRVPAGIYFLRVETRESQVLRKVCVVR